MSEPRTDDDLMSEAVARGWLAMVTEYPSEDPPRAIALVWPGKRRHFEAEADTMNAALNSAMDLARSEVPT